MATAFDPIEIGGLPLKNRITMAAMTRSRATAPAATVIPLTATYYKQRSSAGLIITEGIQPSVVGQGYPNTPGLHTQEQVESWKVVTDAVHAEGGVIFAQLMHTGRIGHPVLLPDGLVPVAPSAVRAEGSVYTSEGMKEHVVPRELSEDDILSTIQDYATAARNAIAAGFDGVEIHGANGYLPHQFFTSDSNRRTDGWGGDVEGRIRFGVEIAKAIAAEIGANRVGFRISPGNRVSGIVDDSDLASTYGALVAQLAPLGLAYLHVLEATDRAFTLELRAAWPGVFILNPKTEGPTGPDTLALIEDGTADLISFARLFLANPDLPARLATGGPFNEPDAATFYGGDEHGYTDYPVAG